MKRIVMLLLLLPVVVLVQAQEKTKSKYEDFLSKNSIFTTVTYPVPEVKLVASYGEGKYTETVTLSIEKISAANTSMLFLSLFHHSYDNASSVILETADVKELLRAIKEMQEKRLAPMPIGASNVRYTYFGNEGISVECNADDWSVLLERYGKDKIYISDITPLLERLQDVIDTMESLK